MLKPGGLLDELKASGLTTMSIADARALRRIYVFLLVMVPTIIQSVSGMVGILLTNVSCAAARCQKPSSRSPRGS